MLRKSLTQKYAAFIQQLGKSSAQEVLVNRHRNFKMDSVQKLPFRHQRIIFLLHFARFPTAFYLHKIHKIPSASCQCGAVEETVIHLLALCPKTHAIRISIWPKGVPSLHCLLYGSLNDLCATIDFLQDSGRLQI